MLNSQESHLAFIKVRKFDWASHGLEDSSNKLHELFTNIEKVVQMNMEKLICGQNVMQNLKECILASVDVCSYQTDSVCEEHQVQQRDYMLNLLYRVKIHHYIRIRNRQLQQLEMTRK